MKDPVIPTDSINLNANNPEPGFLKSRPPYTLQSSEGGYIISNERTGEFMAFIDKDTAVEHFNQLKK